jgi:AcrR family transcriptional regulator
MRITADAKDATRKRILSVAQRQFAKNGFETTTTRDIARAANIAIGTLFNYFPTKESIVDYLVSEACTRAAEQFSANSDPTPQTEPAPHDGVAHTNQQLTLEEELFAHIAASLRSLKPLRKYLPALLETTLSPTAHARPTDGPSVQSVHLETVEQIVARHGHHEVLTAIGLQLYWTLYTGVLAFWASDKSPRQEDTLALVDQSLAMFVGWLTNHSPTDRVAESTTVENER